MKLTIICLTAAILHVSARGLSQTVTFSGKAVPLEKIFSVIKQQTGYLIFFPDDALKEAHPVTVDLQQVPLETALKIILKGQPLEYEVQYNSIVIARKVPTATEGQPTTAPPPLDIHGRVTDSLGNPLQGVTVSVKGSKTSTATDKEGYFSIKVDRGDEVLLFSSIGMLPAQVAVNHRQELTVSLKAFSSVLEEVKINTGFQTVRKEEMTGATVTVTSTELGQRYQPNIINNLEGRVSGLVNYRGNTQIRGVSTIQASTAVLTVVDGLPIEGAVANINPYDVESITVLKDAAATAIYGARASNGVIVVVTKKAKGRGTVVEFSSDVTITDKPNIDFQLLTPAQTVDLESSFWTYNYNGTSTPLATALSTTANNISLGNSVTPVNYAWYQYAQGAITQAQLQSRLDSFKLNNFRQQYKDNALVNDVLQQYNLSIRTGTDKLQTSIVVNYKMDNTGIINGYNNQLNLFYKGTYFVDKWLNINYGINAVLGQAKANNSSFATSATNVPAYQQLLDANGHRVQYTTADFNAYNTVPQTTPQLQGLLVNHLDELSLDNIKSKTTNTRYYVNMDVKLLPGLLFNPYFQYESNQTSTSAYSEQQSYTMRLLNDLYTSRTGTAPNYTYSYLLPTTGGKLATTQTNGNYWTARGQLSYLHEFGRHLVDVIGGTEFRQQNVNGTKGLLLGYDDQLQSQSTASVNFNALSLLTVPTLVKTGFQLANTYAALANSIGVVPDITHRYGSGYANASYTYDRKYNAFGSFRKDYADVFGLDPKFRGKPLWSVGTGWNIHNESFMSDIPWVNFLKLRATYGVTGNINLNTTSFLTATTGATNPLTQLPQATIANPANPSLRWEKTATVNLGVDFALFRSRLNGSLDWYRKTSTDLFANTRLDPATGFSNFTVNNGSLLNNGIELNLDYSWFKPNTRNGFGWSTLLVVSHNSNRITYVDQLAASPLAKVQGGNAGSAVGSSIPSSYTVGYPVNSLFSFQYKGLNAVGQPQWLKADKTLTTQALTATDMSAVVYSGQMDPRNNISITNNFSYKGFTLNILMVYYGGQSFRANVPSVYQAPTYAAMPSYLLDSWTPTHTNTNIPGFGQYVPPAAVPANHLNYSDVFVRPGDFIKIRNVVLGYNLSQSAARKIGSGNVNIHVQLNNPKALWWKNKIGYDPETLGAPIPTSYVIGISVRY